MNREQAEQLLAAFLFDELDPADRAALEQTLEAEPALREQLADMRLTVKLLDEATADESLPALSPQRYRSLMAAVQREETEEAQAPKKPSVLASIGPRTSWAFRIAVLVLIGTAFIAILMPALSPVRQFASGWVADNSAIMDDDYDGQLSGDPEGLDLPEPTGSRARPGSEVTAANGERWKNGTGADSDALIAADETGGRNRTDAPVAGPEGVTTKSRQTNGDLAMGYFEASGDESRSGRALGQKDGAVATGEAKDTLGRGLTEHDIDLPRPQYVGTPQITAAPGKSAPAPSELPAVRGTSVNGSGTTAATGGTVLRYEENEPVRLGIASGKKVWAGVSGEPGTVTNGGFADKSEKAEMLDTIGGGSTLSRLSRDKERTDPGVRPNSDTYRKAETDGDDDRDKDWYAEDQRSRGRNTTYAQTTAPAEENFRKRPALPEKPEDRLAGIIQRDVLGNEGGEVIVLGDMPAPKTSTARKPVSAPEPASPPLAPSTLRPATQPASELEPEEASPGGSRTTALDKKTNLFWSARRESNMEDGAAPADVPPESTTDRQRLDKLANVVDQLKRIEAEEKRKVPDFADAPEFDLSSIASDEAAGQSVFGDIDEDRQTNGRDGKSAEKIRDRREKEIEKGQESGEVVGRWERDMDRKKIEEGRRGADAAKLTAMARQLEKQGEDDQSIRLYQQALKADPQNAEARRKLEPLGMTTGAGQDEPDEQVAQKQPIAAAAKNANAAPENEVELPVASKFKLVPVNPWVLSSRDHLSTFALDVDTASYALCRNYLRKGYLPPRGAVRMEEFINAFDYNYPRRARDVFNIHAEAAPAPFGKIGADLVLLKVGVQGKVIGRAGRKPAHLVFVVDTSGSMARWDRLPLVQHAMKQMVSALNPTDRISLIAYGDKARLLLEAVPANKKTQVYKGINLLKAGDSTNLQSGLIAGYELAQREFVAGHINRVILCSDGVANVGQTDAQTILRKVEAYKKHGITLTAAGFGHGSYNDELMEELAKNGDGNYLFIDSAEQAEKVFVEQMTATLQTIALDAKIQVDFNPHRVRRYRLIGYEKRDIEDARFRDDTVDAAEIGSGKSGTALYELELIRSESERRSRQEAAEAQALPLGTVYVRYRDADTGQVEEIEHRLDGRLVQVKDVKDHPRYYLAACAAEFAELLRQSEHATDGNLARVQSVMEQVCAALPLDQQARELLDLIRRAKGLPRAP